MENLRLWLWKTFGLAVWRTGLPPGASVYFDLHRLSFNIGIALDVGANVGKVSIAISSLWPMAQVHAFEPVSETFNQLVANLKNRKNAQTWKVALSNVCGQSEIFLHPQYSELSSLCRSYSGSMTETINTQTLDTFVIQEAIPQIDLLKIDTEGHEKSVLGGAVKTFEKMPPTACIIEGGFNSTAPFVSAMELGDWFEARGYRFAGLYDAGRNQDGGFLERADLLFIHKSWHRFSG